MKRIILFTVLSVFFLQSNAQTAIQEFNFNGTLTNTDNTISFSGIVKYVNDREGIANNAIRVVNTTLEATISNLPLANTKRSISMINQQNIVESTGKRTRRVVIINKVKIFKKHL